ncbi:hypothetical protein [Nocardia gipuzkoensis]
MRLRVSWCCLPGWWFTSYVFVFSMFTAVAGVLIAVGVAPVVAVWVPIALSAATIAAMRRLRLAHPVLGGVQPSGS